MKVYKLLIIDQIVSAGGVERYLFGLVEGFKQLSDKNEWEVTLLVKDHNSGGHPFKWPNNLEADNIKVYYLPDKRSYFMNKLYNSKKLLNIKGTGFIQRIFWQFFLKFSNRYDRYFIKNYIERFCAKKKFDLVFFSYPYGMDCPDVKAPICSIPHDFNYKHSELNTVSASLIPFIDKQVTGWMRNSVRLIVSSNFIADELAAFYPEFRSKVDVVRLGISDDLLKEVDKNSITNEIILKLPQTYVLTTGWIVPHKNQMVLFKALEELKSRGLDIAVVSVGPNSELLNASLDNSKQIYPYLKEVIEFIKKTSLKLNIDYFGLGFVDDQELAYLYQNASMLCMPTLYEAGSFPVLEAMFNKCPVVCSNIPPLVEQVQLVDNSAVLFRPDDSLDLADKIEFVLNNKSIIDNYKEIAFIKVSQIYSWSKTADQYFKIFKEIIDNKINYSYQKTDYLMYDFNSEITFIDDYKLVSGWSVPEGEYRWSEGEKALIQFSIKSIITEGKYNIYLYGAGYGDQNIIVYLNNRKIADISFTDLFEEKIIGFHFRYLKTGINNVILRIPDATRPSTNDKRKLGFCFKHMKIQKEE